MKRQYFKLMLFISISACLCACKKYLDVKPEDKILEEQVFSNRTGINNALNGLYINLSKNSLYGDNLTLSTVEILAQRYNINQLNSLYQMSLYAYTDKTTAAKIDEIWTNAYATILNANTFIENLDKYKGVLDANSDSLYHGEATGIRAMLHFDLLRLFGPVYNTSDSVKASIPYYQHSKTTINDLLPANKVLDLITADLARAERLLKNDPVIKSGVLPGSLQDGNDFLRNRNYRMNYYAVKALQARVNIYRGNMPAALQAAQILISNADKFKWTTVANALNEKANPDRVFSTEIIFGLQNTQLYTNYANEFDPALEDSRIFSAIPDRLATVFESNENDYRYKT
ncbi:RagB/SusD family nutrient uptake outer membrane protein [Pedobacter sp. NJ-S-72]